MATTSLLANLLFILHLSSTLAESSDLKLGVILPSDITYPWSLKRVVPAIEMAVETVIQQGLLPDYHITINISDSQCSETYGPLAVIDMFKYNGAHVFFGPVCDYALAPVARFTPYWNIPLLSAGGLVTAFDNKEVYTLLTRLNGGYSNAAFAIMAVAREFNWVRFGLIYHDTSAEKTDCYFKMEALFHELSRAFNGKPWFSTFEETRPESYNFTDILKNASKHARILVVCASDDSVREMMLAAHDLNFDNGQYAFISIDILGSKNSSTKSWFRADDIVGRNEKTRRAYQALLRLTIREPSSPQYIDFSREVKRRAKQKYIDVIFEDMVSRFVGVYHDAVILYALALNETLADGFSVWDGDEITTRMWNKTFEGVTGVVNINENGDRINDFSLLDMDPVTGEFQVVGNYFGSLKRYEPTVDREIHWAGTSGKPPLDTPRCGFDQPVCPPTPPQAPRDLRITYCMSQSMSAELRWEQGDNGGSEITGYLVQFNTSANPLIWINATEISGALESVTVELYPWAGYRFRVLAKNEIGFSEPSLPTEAECVLPPERPLQHPSDVRTLTHEKGKLIIAWTPLPRLLQGGPGLHYIISWRSRSITIHSGWDRMVLLDPGANRFETRVTGTYRLFEVRVEADNAFGGAPQEPRVHLGRSGEAGPLVIPQGLRLDVTKPLERDRAHFFWEAVDTSPEAIQGEFRGYKLHCESGNGVTYDTFISKGELDRQHRYVRGTILGLPAGTTIQAKVAVVNTHYTGSYSDTLTFRTKEDPNAEVDERGSIGAIFPVTNTTTSIKNDPGVVEITNITATSKTIYLTWTIPSHLPESTVSKYRIGCRYYADGRWRTIDCSHFTTKKRQVTMDHLTPASMYKVRVKVKTKGNKKNVIQSNWYQVNTTGLQDASPSASHPIRLPGTIRPLHYRLTFDPKIYGKDESDFSSKGSAEITISCNQRTDKILLHSKNLNWTKLELRNHKRKQLNIIIINTLSDVEMMELKAEKPLKVNKTYHLFIEFSSRITDILQGFYYSPYKENNSTKYIFTTMMQPTDARRVFPCFDEPDFKATFQINIVRQESLKTTSNAALHSTESREDGYVIDRYAVTPKMSTYLVAFAIGDMDFLETATGTTQLRTWARKDVVQRTKFALDIGAKLFKFFENYFQIKYPMEKIDMVAVPTMIFNGMEHWGMVTYRESGMLYEEGVSSEADKEWTAILIAHELSHQWFGDLVSPQWWDSIWLNEGFATYMMFLGVDAILPEWKMMNKLPVNYRGAQNAMSIDDSLTSHPVYVAVSHPDEINEIFDLLSYAKGCAVIRMMDFFLGHETFIKGLNRYLNAYSYRTATHDDLWRVLEEQSADDGNVVVDVKSVMDTWLLEENYPVVTVSRDSLTSITLTQTAFLLNESERKNRSNVYWDIPFVYTHQNEQNFNKTSADIIWLHKDGAKVHVVDKSLQDSTWIIGNVQQIGFYRVNYDKEHWRLIVCQLNKDHLAIHPINRAQIINDAWNLARAGMLDHHTALSTLDYLDQEEDYVPWKAAFRELDYLDRSLQLTPFYGQFINFMRKKLENVYNKSVEKDSHYDLMHHSAVTTRACKYDLEACAKAALTEFDRWLSDSSYRIEPDLKISVYCTGVRVRGGSVWDKVLQRFTETQSSSERAYLLQALSSVYEPWIIKRLLQMSLSTDVFTNTEKVDVVDHVSNYPTGRLLAWDFVAENWNAYFERYGSGLNLFAKLVKGLTKSYNTEAELQKVESFVKEHEDLGTATREFQKSIAKIKFNVEWMKKYSKQIENRLAIQTGYGTVIDCCHE